MPKFKFDIEKTYHGEMIIEAKDDEEAEKIMQNKLNKVKWDDDPNFQYMMTDESGFTTEWTTFD